MKLRFIYGVIVSFVITACAGGSYSGSSPYFNIPVGSKIIVTQGLKIYPASGRVFIQNGKMISLSERDQYEYYCWFLSWTVKEEIIQTIEPDTFTVLSVRHTDFYVKGMPIKPYILASSNNNFSLVGGGGATGIEYTTELSIHSEKQPDIRRLACSYWGGPYSGRYITLPEMKVVLGAVVKIEISRPPEGNYK